MCICNVAEGYKVIKVADHIIVLPLYVKAKVLDPKCPKNSNQSDTFLLLGRLGLVFKGKRVCLYIVSSALI